mgnify:CR=1 FL=1
MPVFYRYSTGGLPMTAEQGTGADANNQLSYYETLRNQTLRGQYMRRSLM